jgi:hypothetical protein
MMAARQAKQGGNHRATIHDGLSCFWVEDLHDAKSIPQDDCKEYALEVTMMQYSIWAGIKKFKDHGEAGVSKELTQIHKMQVFWLICKDNLTYDEMKKALALLMFLKEKQDNLVKAQCVPMGTNRGRTGQSRNPHPQLLTQSQSSSWSWSMHTKDETWDVSTSWVCSYMPIQTKTSPWSWKEYS